MSAGSISIWRLNVPMATRCLVSGLRSAKFEVLLCPLIPPILHLLPQTTHSTLHDLVEIRKSWQPI
jgi:hypothetical protein